MVTRVTGCALENASVYIPFHTSKFVNQIRFIFRNNKMQSGVSIPS